MEKTTPTDFEILQYLCNTGDDMDIAMCPDFVRSNLTKRGSEITMGAAEIASQKLMNNEWMPVLYLFNKKKFFDIKKNGFPEPAVDLPSELEEGHYPEP